MNTSAGRAIDPGSRWRPAADRELLELRARLRRQLRSFFADRGILEVETPLLLSSSGCDPHVPVIPVWPHDSEQPRFLHTSPEHAMKRLLCAGSGDIYQLVPVFRDGENGQHHNPEFMMVEWYRLGFDYLRLAEEASQLVSTLLGLGLSPRYQTYQQVFQEHLGVDPLHDDSQILLAAGQVHSGDTFDPGGWGRADLLDWLFASAIQPLLGEGIVVIHEYPAEQAALARLKPQDPRVALRFEIFFNGIELANGFHELADPVEQQRRFEVERLRYAATGREVPPLDQALLAALGSGLPDCSGVALGFDRVVMLAAGRSSIREVMSFPYDRI